MQPLFLDLEMIVKRFLMKQLNLQKHSFFFAAFNHLVPFPKTGVYKRLKEEKDF